MPWFLLSISLIACGILSIRLICLNRELKRLSKELKSFSKTGSRHLKLSVSNHTLEEFTETINLKMDEHKREQLEILRKEEDLKRSVANMSHDLRTPLTSVIGYVQLLSQGNLSLEKQKEYLEVIERRAKSLNELVQSFFELSLVESGEYPVDMKDEDISSLICETMAEYYEELTEAHITPLIQLPKEQVIIPCSAPALRRVLQNLIQNARRHGSKSLEVKLTSSPEKVILSISNPAPNVAEKDIPYLFNRTYTTDRSRSNKSTGLGLFIAKKLVEEMGGKIEALLKEGVLSIQITWEKNKDLLRK